MSTTLFLCSCVKVDVILVALVISCFVEIMRLLPACMETHGALILQLLIQTTDSASGATSKALLFRVTH